VLVDPLRVGRVIARPFVGSHGKYERTGNRHDYGVPPPAPTLLDRAQHAQRHVISVGKIGDLFCHRATGKELSGASNDANFDRMLDAASSLHDGGLLFVNLVDFDTLYGHRRNCLGYAAALEAFDRRLPELTGSLRDDDLVIVTGDHGCDPTWPGTDHTRECVPVVSFGPAVRPGSLGRFQTFSAIGHLIARHLHLP
jgi:phosphopentomutase